MKKLIIIFLLFIATCTATYSQVFIYTATEISVDRMDGNGYVKTPVRQDIILDFDENLIILDSLEIFNVNNVERIKTLKYSLLKCSCYDSSGRYRTVELFLYPKLMYVKIYYNKVIYKYKVIY